MPQENLRPETPGMNGDAEAPGPIGTRTGPWLRFPRPVAWVVLALSLTASVVGWYVSWKNSELRARRRFDEEAGRVAAALQQRMQVYEDVLHGAAGLFAASITVERAEWRAYMESVSIERRFPGVAGVGYIERVRWEELASFLAKARGDNAPQFQLQDPGAGEELLIIKFVEPEATYASLLGRDIGADVERRAVAERAGASGAAALSSTVKLHDGSETPAQGFMMLLPVYRHGAPLESPADREAAIEGWVFARFVTEQLLWAVLGDEPPALHLRIQDFPPIGDDAEQSHEGKLIFDQYPTLSGSEERGTPLFSTVIACDFGGRTWTLNFETTPSYQAHRYGASVWVGAGGGVISLLLFGIAWSLSHTRERALGMAAEMTRTLRQTNNRLHSEIRERERSEAALKHSEALYHSLVESLPLHIVRKDARGCFTFANQRFCSELDMPLEQLLGKTDAEVFPPGLARRRALADRQALEQNTTLESVEEWPGPEPNRTRYVQAIRAPLYDEEKRLSGLLGIFWDVTDKHRAQADLEYERFLLRTLMDNVPDRIYFKDQDSRFVRNNRAHLRTFGLSRPEEAVGKSDFDFFSEEHAREAYDDEQELMARGEAVTKEERETWPDGSVTWALSTKMPLRDDSGKTVGTFGISRDITDRKRAEEALRLAKEAAEEANETKSRFLANMSHELRTPLNSVIGFANILLKNKTGGLGPAELNFLERILANGKHLLTLINEILDLSKIEARKTELQVGPVALDTLIRETTAQQESLVRDRPIELRVGIPERVDPILADADKLRQVIINLIGNALKFTEHGSVTVKLNCATGSAQPESIEVSDTGIGISPDKLHVIFEAFQQADAGTARKYGGTGLGLTISQALCRLMGYRLEVASQPGAGSTFTVHLAPTTGTRVSAPPVTATRQAEKVGRVSDFKGKVVLVIDDDLDSRTLLAHAVEELGCQAIVANSGEQGLRMAREFRPHLITVDLMMPDTDGWQVIQALKADAQLCHIPVVVVSIVASENRGRILGAVEVLQKPVNRAELLAVLRRCLPPSGRRVLIVDDDDDSRRVITGYLENEDCELRTATDGHQAIEVMKGFVPDLVLLDLIMPGMDGIGLLNHLRSTARFRFLPVVIVTAKELTPAESQQLGRIAQEVVQKGDDLQAELDRVLQAFLCRREEGNHRT